MKNFWINIGTHCMFIGMISILLIILTGAVCCIFNFQEKWFYAGLFSMLGILILASAICMCKNCSSLKKK